MNNENPNRQLSEVAEGKLTLEAFIAQLSDEDLAWLLGGQPNVGIANTFGYGNLPLFGVPNAMSADGPAGLRILPEVGVATTAFPCACLLACTWDPEVTEAVGRAAGEEVKENSIGAWLAPAINIHRNPLCGRNFEYYSEDPLLTGHLAGALVRGVQSNGVAATAKHLALNNKETNRKQSDSRASERAIREIYLKAFEIIVKDYDVWSIMTSYNIINGHRASENADMLNGILRQEWGYEGMVTTDWWTDGEHYKECAAGNDVKMGCGYPERLLEALKIGALSRREMELAAKHILGMILKLD
jgi:beta-glucosidase